MSFAALLLISAQAAALQVTADRCEAPVFERVTLRVALDTTYANPFDSREVRVEAVVTPEGGEAWRVPGFVYRACERALVDGHERVEVMGDPEWQVRLSFAKTGRHTVTVEVADASGTSTSSAVEITATAADVAGMVRRCATDHRYFVTDRGETLFLVGANVCWGNQAGTFSYDTWLPHYAEAGCNFVRLWLSPHWMTFGMNTPSSGYDAIDLANAWRLDYVLEMCERLGLRAMLCIDSFNILRSKKGQYGLWEDSVYARVNGGPLDTPEAYFTDETMRRAYCDRLRYLVARYGYSASVFAWEFWNEVDIVDHYDSAAVTAWHRDMACYLRDLDPWKHLIGTSHASPKGDPDVDALPELDFVQTHHYGARDIALVFANDRETKAAAADRPHFHGEFGITGGGETPKVDPKGIHVHNGLYSSVGRLDAGTPMTWWWDSYVEPCKLYPVFAAFARWIHDFDFVAQKARAVNAEIHLVGGSWPRTPEDAWLNPEVVAWQPAPSNVPMTVVIARDGTLTSEGPLSRISHGVRNHPDLHNPVTFEVDAPEATSFGVEVNGVSGHGGAALRISVDGEAVLTKDLVDVDGMESTKTLNEHDGLYSVEMGEGRHTILVENTGNDWFFLRYRVPWLKPEPPLRVSGVQGDAEGLVWIQNRVYTWSNATRDGFEKQPVCGAALVLHDWGEGRWRVDRWDTVSGTVVDSQVIASDGNHDLVVPLPDIPWDAAYRFAREFAE